MCDWCRELSGDRGRGGWMGVRSPFAARSFALLAPNHAKPLFSQVPYWLSTVFSALLARYRFLPFQSGALLAPCNPIYMFWCILGMSLTLPCAFCRYPVEEQPFIGKEVLYRCPVCNYILILDQHTGQETEVFDCYYRLTDDPTVTVPLTITNYLKLKGGRSYAEIRSDTRKLWRTEPAIPIAMDEWSLLYQLSKKCEPISE